MSSSQTTDTFSARLDILGDYMFSALIVEDDKHLNSMYSTFLSGQGYKTFCAYDANEALRQFEDNHIDIVLCDIMISSIDGIMVVEAIRELDEEVPVIMLTVLDDFRSKQRAFSAGSDDYMVKPVDLNELLLRIAALLRRAHATSKQRVVIGDAVLDNTTLTVVEGANSTVLPPKEFMVLFKLCASPGRIFTRRDIMNDVWGIHAESNERTVDVHVKRLRERFAESRSFRIETVRGIGYKVVAQK